MTGSLEFTGERFTPECEREIWYEHYHRYALATRWCANKRTLDAACGEGYGSALLAQSATSVEGVDISEQAVAHAQKRYAEIENLGFHVADCIALPFSDNEFDRVVSFETLEHLAEHDQLLAEFRRVLKPDGCLIISSPDKATYSDEKNAVNEYHVKELYRDELEALIATHFPASHLLGQKLMFHSGIWSMDKLEHVTIDEVAVDKLTTPASITQPPMYFIALCAALPENLPPIDARLWLFDDREESVYRHYHGEIRRNMAAGGIITGLEEKIEALKQKIESLTPAKAPWWHRFTGKS